MKIISILSGLSTMSQRNSKPAGAAQPGIVPEWARDPLAHPDLDAMSERELADLPFGRVTGRAAPLAEQL
jgi:hypothetical protein